MTKSVTLAGALLAGALASGSVWADTNCVEPVADWQPREVLREQLEQHGWTIQRIKIDDGCYEVRGTDRKGNRIKGKFTPASLRIQKLEVEFADGGDPSDYLDAGQKTQ
jgi:hypothetical protein